KAVLPNTIVFVLKDASNSVVPATVSYNSATNTATLAPSVALASSTTYTATVSGAQDSSGQTIAPVSWSFTTAVADTVPPTLTSRTPAAGAQQVWFGTALTATFSKPVQASTVSFTLADAAGNPVAAAMTYDASTNTATLTPASPLAVSSTYTTTVQGARDLAGNTMTPVSWSFTTAAKITNLSIWSASATPAVAAAS